ncbi:MAG: hypothetical protein ACR2P2_08120 [Nakamurella sp.]
MPDDDPIEDLQRAGATAGAAGARAVEAALRSRQQQVQQRQDQQAASDNRAAKRFAQLADELDPPTAHVDDTDLVDRNRSPEPGYDSRTSRTVTLNDPDTWGSKDEPVTEAQQWTLQKSGIQTPATKGEASKLIRDMYDSTEARAGRHDAMEAAGVPLEARQAAVTADKMNATDPANAARSGSVQKTHRPRTARQPQRERGR